MKAITVYQPWASAIAIGSKRFETRSWQFPKSLEGHIVAIHASMKIPTKKLTAELEPLESLFGAETLWGGDLSSLPLGAVVGFGMLVRSVKAEDIFGSERHSPKIAKCICRGFRRPDCPICSVDPSKVRNTLVEWVLGDWTPGRFGWEFADVQQLETPIPCKGNQGFWNVPWEVQAAIRREYMKRYNEDVSAICRTTLASCGEDCPRRSDCERVGKCFGLDQ